MSQAIRAIVRSRVPGLPFLKPGSIVHVSKLAFDIQSGLRFPAVLEASPDFLFRLKSIYLLPYKDFLQRRPVIDYWTLLFRPHVATTHADQFLFEPNKESIGPVAFRFESLGEVLHYLQHHGLTLSKFKIAHVLDVGAWVKCED